MSSIRDLDVSNPCIVSPELPALACGSGVGVDALVCAGVGVSVGICVVLGCLVLVGCKVGATVGSAFIEHPTSSNASVAHRAVKEILVAFVKLLLIN